MDWFLFAWPTLILLAIGLRMSLRILYGARGPDENDLVFSFLNVCSWVLLAAGLLPVMVAGLVSFVGIIVIVMAAVTLVEVVTQRRTAQRRSIARLLSLYISREHPLSSSGVFSARALSGPIGRAAETLLKSIDHGIPFLRAVRENPTALPREAVAYLTASGTTTGQAAALRELGHSDDTELTVLWRSIIDRVSYLSCVLLVMFLILTFVLIKIMPEYAKIFEEFDLELPAMTQLVVASSSFFVHYLAAPAIFLIGMVALAGVIIWAGYLGGFAPLRPIIDRVFRSRRKASVLRILAVAAEERAPLGDALGRMALTHPSAVVCRSLHKAANLVNDGGDWADALCVTKIVSTQEVALLKSAQRTGSLPWALRQIADRSDKLMMYRLASLINAFYPFVIVFLGTVVGFYVIGLFIPLVKLIDGMAQ